MATGEDSLVDLGSQLLNDLQQRRLELRTVLEPATAEFVRELDGFEEELELSLIHI